MRTGPRGARIAAWLLIAACASAVPARAADDLDAQGRLMLAPARYDELRPEILVARLRLRASAVVADVGAGPGFLTLVMARAVPRGRVVATDVNASYLGVAARRAREAGVANVETRVVTPDDPGLGTRAVDAAVLLQVDHLLADRRAYLGNLATALRPRGRIVIVNFEAYRRDAIAAARAAGLEIVDEWRPSERYFAVVLVKR